MKRRINKIHKCGFTLTELLTVVAVIGILLGLLIPALNQVSKTAAKVKQQAQFHSIGLALEAFRNDYGDYPPSVWNTANYGLYSASQRLAEALVGRDGLGFHPSSRFHLDGKDSLGTDLYAPAVDPSVDTANLAARKGPYLELESANAVDLSNIISIANGLSSTPTSYALLDNYKILKNQATGKDVGMPILYYKANKMKIGNDPAEIEWPNNTYNFNDSYCSNGGSGLGFVLKNIQSGTSYTDAADAFYKAIKNPNFTFPERPYRAESFLLQSAGPDGLYGTADDLFNFDQDN